MANTNDIPSAFLNPEILNIADYFQPDLNARTNCNLSLSDILELIYFFVNSMSIGVVRDWTQHASNTVAVWYSMLREVCSEIIRPFLQFSRVFFRKKDSRDDDFMCLVYIYMPSLAYLRLS